MDSIEMNFKPDEKLVLKCVLSREGLTDSTTVQISSTEIQDDVPAKINNTSKVLRMKIYYQMHGQPKKASLVIKIPFLQAKISYEKFKESHLFAKEACFYHTIAPSMQQMLRSDISPTLFASDEQHILYMDDLSACGYRTQVDGQLDVEHSVVVVQHLARMHAASHVLHAQDASLFDDLIEKQFFIRNEVINKIYVEVKPLMEALAREQCLSPEMVQRFDVAVQKTRSDLTGNLDSSRFDFNVLVHGDLKAHNILFKYDQQSKPVQCSLIDFQVCCWSSPLLDIIFYTILSMEQDVFTSDFDRLLELYVSTINKTFEELNCDVRLNKAHLRRAWDELKAIKIFSFLFRMIIDIREFRKVFEYGMFKEASPQILQQLSQSAEIQDRVRFWLNEFDSTGVI